MALVVNREKKNNNVEVDQKEDSISKTSSDESSDESSGKVNKKNKNKDDDQEEDESSDEYSVKVPEFLPLTIGTKTVITQGIALSVGINGKKYSNSMLQKRFCMLKRGPYKGVEIPYIVNDVYINEHNN